MTSRTTNRFTGSACYDAAGNLLGQSDCYTYAYDAENRLIATAGVTYTYDGDGKRVSKSTGGAAYKLYWTATGSDPLEETNGSGNTTNEYIFFGGKRIARRDSSGNVFYYFADHLGTSRTIVQAGQTSACYDADFYPYGGERTPITNSCSQNYKFTGKERDAESGLDNFGARYDSSWMGRFMSVDPANASGFEYPEDPQSWNGYSYARNNPARLIDPKGTSYCQVEKDEEGQDRIVNCVPDEEYDKNPSKYEGYVHASEDQSVTVTATEPDDSSAALVPLALSVGTVAVADGPSPIGKIAAVGVGVLGVASILEMSANKDNAKVVAGLIATAWEHIGKLKSSPPQDPNRNKWKNDVKGALDRAERIANRLPGAAREDALQAIRTIRGLMGLY